MAQKYLTDSGLRLKADGTRETLEEAAIRVGRRRAGWIAGAAVSAFLAVGGAAGCADNSETGRSSTWFTPAGNGAGAPTNSATASDTEKAVNRFGFGVILIGGAFGFAAFGVAASRDGKKLDIIRDNIAKRDEHKAWLAGEKIKAPAAPSNDK